MRLLMGILCASLCSSTLSGAENSSFVMVAIGDSITRGFNSGGFFFARPDNSWASGSSKKVMSHASRIEGALGVRVKSYNFSVTGSKIEDIADQVSQAIAVRPSYMTLLIGANDVCSWRDDYKDQLFAFEVELTRQMERLVEAVPDIKILLVSIPDIYHLWQQGIQSNCQSCWNFTGFCKAMLGQNQTDSDRLLVDEKWRNTNESLKYISEVFSENIRFSESVMNYRFLSDEISKSDCFHPSVSGQSSLARETWDDGWFVD